MSQTTGTDAAPSGSGVVRVLAALAIGTAGGALFSYWGMPLAWMMGAMAATTVVALAGARLEAPMGLRGFMVAVIGIMLGAAFTPETVSRAGQWLPSLAGVLLYAATVGVIVFTVLRRLPGYGPISAYFSATPGGLTEMTIVGGAMGGDERVISLIHSVRILVVILVIPFWFRLVHGYVPSGTALLGAAADIAPGDAAILAACAVGGYFAAKRLRVPAAALSGPLLLSALVHVAGITQAKPPAEIVALAQVIIGTAVGCRFSGLALSRVAGTLAIGVATTLAMLAIGFAFAFVLEKTTGLPFAALVLAFSPGGLAEMGLISLSMGIDIAFVSTHHLGRIFVVIFVAPLVFRLLAVGSAGGDGPAPRPRP